MEIAAREVLEELLVESKDHLETIEPDLLKLEGDLTGIDGEVINRIFRGIHSIKGGFGFLGIGTVQNLAHAMESVLMKVRDGKLEPTAGMVDVLLQGVDRIRDMLADVEASDSVDAHPVYLGLKPWLDEDIAIPARQAPPAAPTGMPGGASGFIPLGKMKALRSATVGTPGPAPSGRPAAGQDSAAPALTAGSGRRTQTSEVLRVKVSLLNQLMNLAGELVLARNQILQSLNKPLAETTAGLALAQAREAALEETRLRLETALCERVAGSDQAGGACDRARDVIRREIQDLKERLDQAQPTRLRDLPGMNATIVNLDGVTTSLQESIMQTRMQSMDALFGKLPRQVRELGRKTGKEIFLEVSGNEVELDKSIIEALSDPLNHMIRNSLDHGIETPSQREAAGKPACGRLVVRAFHEGGQVTVEIADDGRGIDPDRIRAKALEKGLITTEQALEMDDREAVMLVMAPGFSTAEQVSDISGRGVGMDVVRSNIESLNGTIDIDSKTGRGTRMTIKLPLTLAIIPSLLVRSAGRRFAVPQVSLDELVRLRNGDDRHRIEAVQGKEVLRLRGRLLPLLRLNARLGLMPAAAAAESGGAVSRPRSARATTVLVLKYAEHRYGLVVDEVLDSEEIVVKPLPASLKDSRNYAGATIMGDGSVAMILDVMGIADGAGLKFGEADVIGARNQENDPYLERTESQSLLLFRNHPSERFALNLDMVARIEKVQVGDVKRIGGREYLEYESSSLRLIRLQDLMPVKPVTEEPAELFVIVPKLVRHPLGILATSCEDVISTRVQVERENFTGCGVLGSAVINREFTVFVDIFSLFEAAEPEIYGDGPRRRPLGDLKILLAEDTSFFRAMIKKYVESLGCTITMAKDGQEAWDILRRPDGNFDLLITDIEMPRLNGLELTRKIRAAEGPLAMLPIITLTSLVSEETRRDSLAAGVNAHQVKFDKDALASTIQSVIQEVPARV